MTFPTIFNNLAAGNQPASLLDTMFSVVATMGQVMCTATGTNTIALSPVTNMPTVSSYANYQQFGFVAAATSTGAVTINVSSVGALNAYRSDGTTQLNAGDIVSGGYYTVVYNSSLNSSAGGFQILSRGINRVKTQIFTSTGTYTPTAGMIYCIIECIGGGGGGGGTALYAQAVSAGGGGAGSYSRKIASASSVGSSQTVTIGTSGSGGIAGNNNGNPGGDTSVGSLCVGKGGSGGGGSAATATGGSGGAGGVAGTGDVTLVGNPGFPGGGNATTAYVANGQGGSSVLGGQALGQTATINTGGSAGNSASANSGSGGNGASSVNSSAAAAGGNGATGLAMITEYISA